MATDSIRAVLSGILLCLLMAGGCAANGPAGVRHSNVDPWEPMNRRIDKLNRNVDRITLKPIAKGYDKVTPAFVKHRVTNFSQNLRGPLHIVNNFLQGKGRDGLSETGRFLANSTIGILGLFDVASHMGLAERHEEDFGQTLAVWGVPSGPYVIVPFFGPQTLRDALMLPVDFLADPLLYYEEDRVRYSLYALRSIELRTRFLSVERFIEESFDRYIAVRESYLQNREYEIYDGNPPEDE
ncbi:MAG TPA: VacJ family lipoprotein, partial [Woeseiaceae bacterium]|nr:VacJ family lipoprotein [Woeseiaceae bacterium]